MLSPRFIPQSVYYTQSAVRSPQSAVRKSTQTFPVLPVSETKGFCYQNQDNYFVYEHDLNRLSFGETARDYFHFRNNETKSMLVYQSNPVEVELFSHVNTRWVYVTYFARRNLGQRSEKYTFQKQR